jgi:hypothetical protein
MKIRLVAAKLMHTARGMQGHAEANRTSLQHANMPKWEGDWGIRKLIALMQYLHTTTPVEHTSNVTE